MSKGKSSAPPATQTVVQKQELPGYYQPYIENLLARGQNLSLQDYQGYEGDRLAGLTPEQQASFDIARGAGQSALPSLQTAGQYATRAGQGLTDIDISQYMSPFQQQVIDIAKNEARRDAAIAGRASDAAAVNAGAFGGSRQAIVEAEENRNLADRLSKIQTEGTASAFDRAVSAFNADRSAALGASGALQQQGMQGMSALSSAGQQLQAQEQAAQDLQYQDFLRQTEDPWEKLTRFSSLVYGYQPAANVYSNTQSTQPAPSMLAQLAGAGAGIYGAGKFFGAFKKGGAVKVKKYADGGSVFSGATYDTPMKRFFAWQKEREANRQKRYDEMQRGLVADKRAELGVQGSVLPSLSRRGMQDESVLPSLEARPEMMPPVPQSKPAFSRPTRSALPPLPQTKPTPPAPPVQEEVPAPIAAAAEQQKELPPDWAEALMMAGFKMASSDSPYFLQALGEGGLEAGKVMQSKRQEKRENRKVDLEERNIKRQEKADEALGKINELKLQLGREENDIRRQKITADIQEWQAKLNAISPLYAAQASYYANQPDKEEMKVVDRDQRILSTLMNRFVTTTIDPATGQEVKGVDMEATMREFKRLRPDSPLTTEYSASTVTTQKPRITIGADGKIVK